MNEGWNPELEKIYNTFEYHRKLLEMLLKLGFMDGRELGILRRSFEQQVWEAIRNEEMADER